MLIRRRVYGDRGSSFAQWLALGVLAAVIVAGLSPIVGTSVSDGVSRVICEIVNGGDASKCKDQTGGNKIDTNPQWCLSSMESNGYNYGMSFLVFKIGAGFKEIRYDSREEDLDGKVKHYIYVAYVNSGDAGIDLEKAKGGKKIDVGGGLSLNYGDMYRLTPDQYKKFHDGLDLWQMYLQALQAPDPGGGMGGGGFGVWEAYKIMAHQKGLDWPPKMAIDPTITFAEGTAQGKGEGSIPINLDKKLQSPGKYLLPNGATVGTTQAHTVTVEHWNIYQDPQGNILPATATYHTTSGTYTIGVDRTGTKKPTDTKRGGSVNVGATATYDYSNTTRVTRDDKSGKLRNIRYVITYGDKGSLNRGVEVNGKDRGKGNKSAGGGYSDTHSDGKLHTEVIQINFALDDPANQQIGENWLKNHGLEMPPEVVNEVFPKTGAVPGIPDDKPTAAPPPANADPFDKLIYDRAMGWKTDAETKDQANEFNATLPFGKGVGFNLAVTSAQAKTMKAQILDAPGSDGERHWIDYPDCTDAGNH
ncbi:MAG TPA: hypothetical protein VGL93_00805 [Streptosporangiaceae bacterium]|jgi:hypothetical protein